MQLILLRCPYCAEPLKMGDPDLVVSCGNCFRVVAIAAAGPEKMAVRLAVPADRKVGEINSWLPYWIYQGEVEITQRDTQGGSRGAAEDSREFWAAPRRFFIPAWSQDLGAAINAGLHLLEAQPEFRFVSEPEKQKIVMVPAVMLPSDAHKMLEFIVLALEARRKDWLKDIAFEVRVGQPELWALPNRDSR